MCMSVRQSRRAILNPKELLRMSRAVPRSDGNDSTSTRRRSLPTVIGTYSEGMIQRVAVTGALMRALAPNQH